MQCNVGVKGVPMKNTYGDDNTRMTPDKTGSGQQGDCVIASV